MKTFRIFLPCIMMLAYSCIAYAQTLQDGIKAVENEKYLQAKQIFMGLTKTSPSDAEVYYNLGNLYYFLSQKDSAKLFFEKGKTINPKSASNSAGLGKLMLDDKNATAAKSYFDNAQSSAPKDSKTYQLIGDAYLNSTNKDVTQAIVFFNKSIELNKNNSEAYLLLGDAYLETSDGGGKAMSSYENAVEKNPALAKGYFKIGELWVKSKNNNDAEKAFQKCISTDKSFIPVYRELGELFHNQRQHEKAKEIYQKYISLADTNANDLSRYASFLFLCKDYANTAAVINRVIQMDSSNAVLSRLIGYSYYEQGNFPEGLKFMENFFKKSDSKKIIASDYEYYGKLLAKAGNDSLAVINLKQAIVMDTTNSELHGDIAQIFYKMKKYTEAAQEYELKTGMKTLDYFQMGQAYYFSRQYPKADSAFAKVAELKSNSHLGFFWRGRVNSILDSNFVTGAAKPFYEKCVEIISADSAAAIKYKKDLMEAYSYLGNYYLQKDDNANAKIYYNKILEIDPENKDAKKVIAALKKQ